MRDRSGGSGSEAGEQTGRRLESRLPKWGMAGRGKGESELGGMEVVRRERQTLLFPQSCTPFARIWLRGLPSLGGFQAAYQVRICILPRGRGRGAL